MTILKNKWANIVMDDGWVHPLSKSLPSLVKTCDELLSSMIEIWMTVHLVSDSNCNIINIEIYKEWQIMLGMLG